MWSDRPTAQLTGMGFNTAASFQTQLRQDNTAAPVHIEGTSSKPGARVQQRRNACLVGTKLAQPAVHRPTSSCKRLAHLPKEHPHRRPSTGLHARHTGQGRRHLVAQLGEVVEAVYASAAALAAGLQDPDVVRPVNLPLGHPLPQLRQYLDDLHAGPFRSASGPCIQGALCTTQRCNPRPLTRSPTANRHQNLQAPATPDCSQHP